MYPNADNAEQTLNCANPLPQIATASHGEPTGGENTHTPPIKPRNVLQKKENERTPGQRNAKIIQKLTKRIF